MASRAGNWTLCPRERHLIGHGLAFYPPFPQEVRERGARAEALLASRYPGWRYSQVQVTLPTGRHGYVDYLDEQGEPVEVKAATANTFRKLIDASRLWDGYTYQRAYVIQLAAYCTVLNKSGRMVFVNMDDPTHPEKHFLLTLEDAKAIYTAFLEDKLRPTGCQFCKVTDACVRMYGAKTGYEI